ncbi:hypothetical protein [Undibacterium crateris]|uniref:hypothetical protein n=1 Tax=Undibacterium crateris TaxID=2528175 RepID=UPI00138A3E59|nr:hypothetical protein [Undibacterium crateris]NDI87108.1 hypothetical protein [Undibacterium crateris]
MANQNGIVALLKFCRAWLHQQRIARGRDALDLRGMEDRDLLDLGIGRSEIPGILQQESPEEAVCLRSVSSAAISLPPLTNEQQSEVQRRSA